MALGPLYIHEEGTGKGGGGGAGSRNRRDRQLEQVTGNQDKYDFGRHNVERAGQGERDCSISSVLSY